MASTFNSSLKWDSLENCGGETRQIFCRCLAAFFCRQPHNVWFGYLTFVWPSTLQNATCRTVFYFPNTTITSWMSQFTSSDTLLWIVCDQQTHCQWKMRSTYFTSALITQYNRLNVVDTTAFCTRYQRWNVVNQMTNEKKVPKITLRVYLEWYSLIFKREIEIWIIEIFPTD